MPLSTDSLPSDVNLSNWRTAPYNRWAFHNVRSIIPVAEIAAALGSTLALPESPIALDAFALRLPNGSALDLNGFLKATATDGIVILHDGRIVFEFYDGGTTKQTPHILMSVSKSMLGMLCGILAARDMLDLGAHVTAILPELSGTAYEGATVRHLLDMRSGIGFDEDYLATTGPMIAYRKAVGWIASGDLPAALAEVSLDSLWLPGNATHGFMDFMLMMGVAGENMKADYSDSLDLFHTMEAYFTWYPEAAA